MLKRILRASFLSLLLAPAVGAQAAPGPNRVLQLDGDGDWVQLPAAAFAGLEQATIEAWVRWADFSYYSQWIAFGW